LSLTKANQETRGSQHPRGVVPEVCLGMQRQEKRRWIRPVCGNRGRPQDWGEFSLNGCGGDVRKTLSARGKQRKRRSRKGRIKILPTLSGKGVKEGELFQKSVWEGTDANEKGSSWQKVKKKFSSAERSVLN